MTLKLSPCLLTLLILPTILTLARLPANAQNKSSYRRTVLLYSKRIFRPNPDDVGGIIANIPHGSQVTISMYAYDPGKPDNIGVLLYSVHSSIPTDRYEGTPLTIPHNDLGPLKDYFYGDWVSDDMKLSLMALDQYYAHTRNEYPYPVGDLPYPVVVEVNMGGGVDIGSVKFPGMDAMTLAFFEEGNNFEKVLTAFKDPLDYPDYYVVAAHRGYWKDFPENSYPAYDLTWASGADMVELDTRLTKDDTLVAFHDACLDRVTTGSGKLRDKTWAELSKLNLRDRFGMPTCFHVVSIRQALTYLKGRAIVNLDIKEFPRDNSTGVAVNLWEPTFIAALKIAKETGTLNQLVIKGKYSWDDLQELLIKAGIPLNDFTYTPVAFGWDGGNNPATYVPEWLQQAIPGIELTYKVAYDPILKYIPKAINKNIRSGIYTFWPEDPDGVIAEDSVNSPTNYCKFNYRQYAFLDEDKSGTIPAWSGISDGSGPPDRVDDYGGPSGVKNKRVKLSAPNMLDDGRGDWDWLFSKGANFVITDRPVLMVEYLKRMGKRSFAKPVMKEGTLPECAIVDNGSGGTKSIIELRGMVRRVEDYHSLEFFSPDTRNINLDTNLVIDQFKEYSNGKTRQWVVDYMKDHNGNCTCANLFADSPGVREIRQYPLYNLPEWSVLYPGYDLYINANWFDVKRPWPDRTGHKSSLPKAMYKQPCTNVFGYWQASPAQKGQAGPLLTRNAGDEVFDALLMTTTGTLRMVKSDDVPLYYDDNNPEKAKAAWALSGYIIARNGTPIPYAQLPIGTNKSVQKKRSLIGLNGNAIVFAEFQSPMMEPYQAASLMIKYFNCTDVFMFDAGGSTTMLTSKGIVPAVEAPAGPYIRAGSAPEDKNLDDVRGYRPIPNFMAVRIKQ